MSCTHIPGPAHVGWSHVPRAACDVHAAGQGSGGALGWHCPAGRESRLSCHPPQAYTYPLMASHVSHLASAPGSAPQHEAVGVEGQSTQLGVTCSPPIKLPSPTDCQLQARRAVAAATSFVPGCQHWAGPGRVAPLWGFAPHWGLGQWQGCPGYLPSRLPGTAPGAGPAAGPHHHPQALDWTLGLAAAPGAQGSLKPQLWMRRGFAWEACSCLQCIPTLAAPPGTQLPCPPL